MPDGDTGMKRIRLLKDVEFYGHRNDIIEICNTYADSKIKEGEAILVKDLGSRLRGYKTLNDLNRTQIIDKLLKDGLIRIENNKLIVTDEFVRLVDKRIQEIVKRDL